MNFKRADCNCNNKLLRSSPTCGEGSLQPMARECQNPIHPNLLYKDKTDVQTAYLPRLLNKFSYVFLPASDPGSTNWLCDKEILL